MGKKTVNQLSKKYKMSLKQVNVDVKWHLEVKEKDNHVITHRSIGTYKCDKCEQIVV